MNASAAFKNESLIAPKFACVDLNQNLTEEAASTGFVPLEASMCGVGHLRPECAKQHMRSSWL
jgi:hypothetical protein